MDESVLHRVVGSRTIMGAQLKRLFEASYLPNVAIRVVPFGAGALPAGNNKFIILGFDRPSARDVVYVGSLTGELILDRESDLEVYSDAYKTVIAMAASTEDSRGMVGSLEQRYGE
jgi:hypothetical protein